MVDHQKMVADRIEFVEIAMCRCHLGCRLGRHLAIEDVVAQALRSLDFGHGLRQPDFEAARANRAQASQVGANVRHDPSPQARLWRVKRVPPAKSPDGNEPVFLAVWSA